MIPTLGHPARILIVDDERHNRQLLEVMLTPEGFSLQTASSGEEALEMVARNPPDLVLLDVMMPGMDGFQLAAKIKGNLETKNIPVIMVTVRDDRSARMLGLSAGAEDFLSKPVDRAELCVRVRNLLRLKAYGDYHDKYGQLLEGEVGSRTADLVESERLYRSTFDAAPVGIMHVAGDGKWLRVNQRLCQLLGYSRADLQGSAVQELIRVEDVAGEADAFRRMAAGTLDSYVVDEKRYRRHDGGFVWVRVNTSVHRDADGQFQHCISVVEDITDLRASREVNRLSNNALLASEARYRRIVETTNQGVWMTDIEGRTTFMNARMASMLGYERDEVVGVAVSSLVCEEWDGTDVFRDVARSREVGMQVEAKLKRKDGSTVWALLETTPTIGESGNAEGSCAMVMDITERKKSVEALRVSEGRLMRLWDSSLILITIFDTKGNIRDMNEAGARMLGYSRAELLSGAVRLDELTPPAWGPMDESALAQLSATGVASSWEQELIRRDGSRVAILAGAALIDGSEGIAIAVDVTEKRRVQTDLIERVRIAALAAEVGMALALDDSLPDILRQCAEAMVTHLGAGSARIWTLNARDNVLELQASAGKCKPAFEANDRIPVGTTQIGLIAAERQAHVTNDVPNDARVGDHEWAKREGLIGFAGHPLLVAGQLVGVVAMFARQPLSEVVLTGLGSLADAIAVGVQRKVGEAAGLSLEAQLRQAQKMEAIGGLAGGIAHDFNNLLSVILSYSELLAADLKEGDPMRADLDEIKAAGLRAVDLTRQLLAFSRQQVLRPKIIDLTGIVDGMEKMLRRLIGEDVELIVSGASALGMTLVDPGQVEQVIMNLAVNARDAMPRGGKLIIETADVVLDESYAAEHVGVKPGPHVMLSVSDTGSGMDKETQARMFEPFFTTKAVGKGTGLGLATVFGIVRQSGGTIWVDSDAGRGTTFKVYFPTADQGVAIPLSIQPSHRRTLRGTETVLLVEDEEPVRMLAHAILRRYGYNVLDARNGGDALLLCEQHSETIDLLLTDVVMPRMSGRQLVDRLHTLRPAMKVLYMSGYTDDAVMRHGIFNSTVAFIQKPIRPESLAAKVRDVLDSAAT